MKKELVDTPQLDAQIKKNYDASKQAKYGKDIHALIEKYKALGNSGTSRRNRSAL